ncbi:MAG: TlpA disulfide reductase family protein [Acidobacteriota bacterium]
MDSFSRRFLLTLPAAALASRLDAVQLPRPAIPLTFQWADGTEGSLKKYAGKVIAVEMLLTYCHACQSKGKIMESYYREFKNQGLQVIGLATNDNAEKDIGNFIAASGATFPIGVISRDKAQEFLQHPMAAIFYLPQLAIIDRKGVIRYQHGGQLKPASDEDAQIRNHIAELIKAK